VFRHHASAAAGQRDRPAQRRRRSKPKPCMPIEGTRLKLQLEKVPSNGTIPGAPHRNDD